VAFINSLSRSLENEENCVHLFSRNIDVDIQNYTKIQTVAGELKIPLEAAVASHRLKLLANFQIKLTNS
jgi:hypothetical protein